MRRRLEQLQRSSFFMNAMYLMLSNFVIAGFGFLFWTIITRSYPASEVGLATTLLSVSSLLSLLALAGFDTTFVRFLPASQRKNDYINSGFLIVTILSVGVSMGVAYILPYTSPHFAVLHTWWGAISFVFFTFVTTLNVLTNAVFLAYKKARFIFVINTLFSLVKVILPLMILGNALTIFILAGIAQLVGLMLSLVAMQRYFSYSFRLVFDKEALRLVRTFSLTMYSGSILNLLPPTLLPIIIISAIGPQNSAYYYIAFTIASLLYTIAYSSMQSVFAEGSHDETALKDHVIKAARLIGVVLLPAAILTAILSPLLLAIFGQEYTDKAVPLLQIFALSAPAVAMYSALGAIFKVIKHLEGTISMNIGYAATIILLSYSLLPQFGLIAIGWSWLIGNVTACTIGGFLLWKVQRNHTRGNNHGTTTRTRRA